MVGCICNRNHLRYPAKTIRVFYSINDSIQNTLLKQTMSFKIQTGLVYIMQKT